MKTHREILEQYAQLVIEIGVNVQAGEPVLIRCPVDGAEFARLLARYAYQRGACEVIMTWRDDALDRLRYENAPLSIFEEVPQWAFDRAKYYYEKGVNVISVSSADPELLNGIDYAKIAAASKANDEKFKPLHKYTMADICSWCVVAIPNAAWAKKVFPECGEEEAVQELWKRIFEVTRMNAADPFAAWHAHIDNLHKKAQQLNDYHFASLHYQSANGTNLVVHLPEKHRWLSASARNAKGTVFLPNLPTEEIFTVPSMNGVDGTLVATKPLAYNGTLIEDFSFRFRDGAVTDFQAKKGGHALKGLLEEAPGARRLGECALVPHDSPISNSGLLFYNTLFDENASCHFALGASYPTSLEGGTEMSPEERLAAGANDAPVHEDFMVGCSDLSIRGTTASGEIVDVFVNGNFAI